MSTEVDIPSDVVAEIQANRKVNAIKLLRKQQGLGLTEAKAAIDTYIENNSDSITSTTPEEEGGIGRILVLIIGVSIIVGVYMYFT